MFSCQKWMRVVGDSLSWMKPRPKQYGSLPYSFAAFRRKSISNRALAGIGIIGLILTRSEICPSRFLEQVSRQTLRRVQRVRDGRVRVEGYHTSGEHLGELGSVGTELVNADGHQRDVPEGHVGPFSNWAWHHLAPSWRFLAISYCSAR